MKQKILLGVSILFGLMFINSGLNKIFDYLPQPEMSLVVTMILAGFMATGWLIQLIAVVEIIGGLLFIIPRTRALGAVMIFPIMVGIILFHAFQDPATIGFALVFFVINLWVIWENRAKYMPMIAA